MLGINDPSLMIIIEEKFLTSSLFSIDDFKSKFNSKCLDILNYDDYIQFVKEENSKKKEKNPKKEFQHPGFLLFASDSGLWFVKKSYR